MGREEKPDEFELIARFFAPLAKGEEGALRLGDDAAVLSPPQGRQLVVTADGLTAGVHFPINEPPQDVAMRLIGVNLSDLAAMGATPWAYTLTLVLPENWEAGWLEAFSTELGIQQKCFGMHLVGGDTTATPGPMTLSMTALGTVVEGKALRRSGAESGDRIYVSGTIGDAALGLKVLQEGIQGLDDKSANVLLARYHRPQPRVSLGTALSGLASAAIDISDGLVADLGHLAVESGLTADILTPQVPLSEAAQAAISLDSGLLERALTGGDDYELLFTAPETAETAIAALAENLGLPLTPVGTVSGSKGDPGRVRVLGAGGRELPISKSGYRHF